LSALWFLRESLSPVINSVFSHGHLAIGSLWWTCYMSNCVSLNSKNSDIFSWQQSALYLWVALLLHLNISLYPGRALWGLALLFV
jgi:hypothetical protein